MKSLLARSAVPIPADSLGVCLVIASHVAIGSTGSVPIHVFESYGYDCRAVADGLRVLGAAQLVCALGETSYSLYEDALFEIVVNAGDTHLEVDVPGAKFFLESGLQIRLSELIDMINQARGDPRQTRQRARGKAVKSVELVVRAPVPVVQKGKGHANGKNGKAKDLASLLPLEAGASTSEALGRQLKLLADERAEVSGAIEAAQADLEKLETMRKRSAAYIAQAVKLQKETVASGEQCTAYLERIAELLEDLRRLNGGLRSRIKSLGKYMEDLKTEQREVIADTAAVTRTQKFFSPQAV